ncbi:MAG TPA: protein kinase [Thermoanaerobaculia bacterium]|nr:protein kinase [Thermoanaerobaculia bacterium]
MTRSLGAGAMGEVYAARDTLLGRNVAIKVLLTGGVAAEESRLRFLQEARAASALNHPNIVTIYDVVRDGEIDCIIMELVAGETLDARVARAPLSLEETLDVMDRIADALAAAHARGIVHRDLKPANVMLTPAGGLKILDFGLAKLFAGPEASAGSLKMLSTQSGIVVGTPSFMSPEQVLGKPLDGRSDLFSLGSMGVEMLTGHNPFEADSVVATMHQIAYGAAPSFENVPIVAIPLFEKLLMRDKEQRYQSADELRRAIAELRASSGLHTAHLKVRTASRRTNRVWIAAAALIVIAIGLGAAQIWRTRASASVAGPAPEAFKPPQTAHEHVQRGNQLLATYWRKGYADNAIEEFQRAIALDANHAPAHAGLSRAYSRKFNLVKDRTWLDLALKNGRHAIELDPQLAAAHVAVGVAQLWGGDLEGSRKELEQTLATDPANVDAMRWLAEVASRGKDQAGAEAHLRKALALRPRDPELHLALGWLLYQTTRYDQAAAEFRQVNVIAPDLVAGYRNLAATLHMRGDYAGAARAIQQSLEIEPDVAAYSNLGTLYFFQGLYPQSVTAFEKAVQLGANNHVVWANLGDAYRWTPGNQAKAREAFAAALNLLDDQIRQHPDDATLQSRRALYLAKQGNARGGLSAADALMARKEADPQNLYRLALAFELSGARGKSLDALARAIRNGYSTEEIKTDPELASLRRDMQFQRMMVTVQ